MQKGRFLLSAEDFLDTLVEGNVSLDRPGDIPFMTGGVPLLFSN